MLRKKPTTTQQAGFSLIEVLVALLVLAIGLLGILVMQARGLQLNQAGYLQSQAMFMAEDIVERIRSNQTAIDSYSIDFEESGDDSAGYCDSIVAHAVTLKWQPLTCFSGRRNFERVAPGRWSSRDRGGAGQSGAGHGADPVFPGRDLYLPVGDHTMSRLGYSTARYQGGISFVEVLVAMVIGVIILAGVMQSMLTNQRNNAWSDDVAYVQENARYALGDGWRGIFVGLATGVVRPI